MLDLAGSAAIVTGGSSGLGLACSRKLAGEGAVVTIVDLNEEAGLSMAQELGCQFVKADVASEPDMMAAIEVAVKDAPLRAAVNAAGIGHAMRTVNRDGTPFALEQFEKVVRVNLVGTFNSTRLAAAEIAKAPPVDEVNGGGERGAIVNFASVAAFDGQIGQAAYSATKAAVAGMTLPIARDLSAIGIRINTVAPGLFDTPIYDDMDPKGGSAEEFKARLGQSVLFPKRLGMPDELASLVYEMLTNSYMNAEVVRLDAGVRLPPK